MASVYGARRTHVTPAHPMTKDTHYFGHLSIASSEVNQCSYSCWSKYFTGHIPEAVVLKDVPDSFITYLNSDGITLPPAPAAVAPNSDNEYSDWEDDHAQADPCEGFQDFDKKVQDAIAKYKAVIVKLNWSAPKDAKWILINNSLRCTSNADVYLLLNASDHIAHDLDGHIYEECEDQSEAMVAAPELVIKRWIADFNPALEFRVFVKDNEVVGVSQRDLNHYEFLSKIHAKLHSTIAMFHEHVLQGSGFPLKSYIADIYVPSPYQAVTIIDINPFSRKWDSLLFTWNELLERDPPASNAGARGASRDFELRLITETNMGALARKDHSENQVPIEVVDALMNSEAMIELARAWDGR